MKTLKTAARIAAAGGTSRTVELHSGGTVTLVVSVDVQRLTAAERALVRRLINRFDRYEKPAE